MQEIAHRHTVANFYTTVVVPVAELTLKVYANKGNVTYCVDMHVRSIQQHKYIDQWLEDSLSYYHDIDKMIDSWDRSYLTDILQTQTDRHRQRYTQQHIYTHVQVEFDTIDFVEFNFYYASVDETLDQCFSTFSVKWNLYG